MFASEAILPPRQLLPGATTPTIFVSVALHAAVVAGALLLGMGAPDDTTALESIAVSVISVQTASDSVSLSISDAAQTLVAAGTVSPVTAETVEPLDPLAPPDPEPPTPIEPTTEVAELIEVAPEATAAVVPATIAEAVPLLAVAVATAVPVETAVEPVTPVETTPPAEPETIEVATTAAVQPIEPEPVREVIEPVPAPAPAKPKATPPKKAEPPPKRPTPTRAKPPPPASSGAGGKADANAVAAAPAQGGAGKVNAGGSAATSRYPGLVEARLKRALRFPRGADRSVGRVRVAFTVHADGGAGNIRISASSGSAVLDQAAMETVSRAAPFPPIPADAGRSSWNFTVPLTFRR